MLDLKQVGLRDNFFEVGGYSILATRVVGAINKTLKVHLNIPTFFQNPTIEQLARVIEQKDHARPKPRLVQLQSGRVGLPLYFIGTALPEYRVAQLIGEDRAIFAVDVPLPTEWSDAIAAGNRAALPTIEQLGALYGDALRAHAGTSPCVVVGCYAGGTIAFEAARALQRAGGNIALVLLIDATTWSGLIRGPAWQSLLWIWRAAGTANDTRYMARLSALVANYWRLLLWVLARMPRDDQEPLGAINLPLAWTIKRACRSSRRS